MMSESSPSSAAILARAAVTVVLPTPPFPATMTTRDARRNSEGCTARDEVTGGAVCADRGGPRGLSGQGGGPAAVRRRRPGVRVDRPDRRRLRAGDGGRRRAGEARGPRPAD